jgi:hypothetical protein
LAYLECLVICNAIPPFSDFVPSENLTAAEREI